MKNILLLLIILTFAFCRINENKINLNRTKIEKLHSDSTSFLDVNCDGFNDLILWTFIKASTGDNLNAKVYLHKKDKQYILCSDLKNVVNPDFNFEKNTICCSYKANGGGFSYKLKWNSDKLHLDTLETVTYNIISYAPFKVEHFITTKDTSFNFIDSLIYNCGERK